MAAERLLAPTSYLVPNVPYEIAFLGAPGALRASTGGASGLFLDVRHRFTIVEVQPERQRPLWGVTTRMYEYRLLDHDFRELLVYHWQPGDDFLGPDHPHLHVSASLSAQTSAVDRQSIDLDKIHLATSRVPLAAVVRMLITESHIAPRRPDWAETLDRTEQILWDETTPHA